MLLSLLVALFFQPFCSGCGYTVVDMTGVVQSPNYPEEYGNGISCIWNINVPAGNIMTLEFHDFGLEMSPDCNNDSLTITNHEVINGDPKRTTTATYCGSVLPPLLLSSQESVTLHMVTNEEGRYRGFNASFKAETIGPIICNQDLSNYRGSVSTPYYPAVYPSDCNCITAINVGNPDYIITLTVHEFVTENKWDKLEIFDSITNQLIKSISGTPNVPIVLNSTTHIMKLVFTSDHNRRFKGFYATYEVPGMPEETTALTTQTTALTTVNTNNDIILSTNSLTTVNSTDETLTTYNVTYRTETTNTFTSRRVTVPSDASTRMSDGQPSSIQTTSDPTVSGNVVRNNHSEELKSSKRTLVSTNQCRKCKRCPANIEARGFKKVFKVNKTKTSRFRRMKMSMDDERLSSKAIGLAALAVLIGMASLLVVGDYGYLMQKVFVRVIKFK